MRILVLDDLKDPHTLLDAKHRGENITHVYTHAEAMAAILGQDAFDLVYLDHNLGEYAPANGYDTAMNIACDIPEEKKPKSVIVHSNHPLAAASMVQLLQDAGIAAKAEPIRI